MMSEPILKICNELHNLKVSMFFRLYLVHIWPIENLKETLTQYSKTRDSTTREILGRFIRVQFSKFETKLIGSDAAPTQTGRSWKLFLAHLLLSLLIFCFAPFKIQLAIQLVIWNCYWIIFDPLRIDMECMAFRDQLMRIYRDFEKIERLN